MRIEDADNQANGFALRLREALAQRGKKPSPTALEREFNLRYRGQPISMHAARKWLRGMTVPTQDKLEVLARWLNVSADWLRWGNLADATARERTPAARVHAGTPPLLARQNQAAYAGQEESSLLQDWQLLDTRNRQLIRAMIELLLRDQHEARAGKVQ